MSRINPNQSGPVIDAQEAAAKTLVVNGFIIVPCIARPAGHETQRAFAGVRGGAKIGHELARERRVVAE
jgi:hypothetical protein